MFTSPNERIDWKTELRQARVQWKSLIKKAEDFCTCAVGHQDSIIPRTIGGVPSFKSLQNLGYSFLKACEDRDNRLAIDILKKIEKESNSLSRQCLKKLKSIFKKNEEKLNLYNQGQKIFHVTIDKEGYIVNIKDDSKYSIEINNMHEFNIKTNGD
jgi:hypothetical protein